ncbi:MAG: sigma 54-interacting transcriptional regulator, partial [Terriglobales bacterium]
MARKRQSSEQRPKTAERAGSEVAALSDQKLAANWIAADPESQKLLEQARKVAAGGSTVLIRGESGSGKDLLASLIHYLGPGRDEPLVKIDCASLPLELLESE